MKSSQTGICLTLAVLVPLLVGCATEGPPEVANNGPPTSYRFWPNEPQTRTVYVVVPGEPEARAVTVGQDIQSQWNHDDLMFELRRLNSTIELQGVRPPQQIYAPRPYVPTYSTPTFAPSYNPRNSYIVPGNPSYLPTAQPPPQKQW